MEPSSIAPFLLVAAIVVAVGLIIFVVRRMPGYRKYSAAQSASSTDRERIKAEYAQAGLPVRSSIFSAPSVSGTLSGVAFGQKLVHGGRNSPPRVELSARSALRGEFTVRSEGGSEGFFKSIGFADEAQTGDADFDREFYLAGVSREYVRALFSEAQNRAAVRRLFALGFDRVELQDGELTATRSRHAQLLELNVLREALEQLSALRTTPSAMQVAMQGLGGIRTRHVNTACTVALGIAVSAFMATTFLLEPMVDGQLAMFEDSWRPALIAYGALIGATLLLLRGRANAPRELVMIALLGLPALWIGGVSAAMLANQFLDSSPSQRVRSTLLRYTMTRGKNTSYHFVFASWRRAGGKVAITVPYEIFRKAAPNQSWVLETRAGRLGYEWIDTLEPQTNR